MPLGILKREVRTTFDDMVVEQGKKALEKASPDLKKLLYAGDIWDVK